MNTGLAGQLTLPNDAFSVAVAALRSPARRPVLAEDHAAVLKIWAKRHRDLGRSRNQAACRLHAVLCELVPGGLAKEITAAQAARMIGQAAPADAVGLARRELAAELLADLRRLDAELAESKKKLAAVVRASGTSVTGLFGVGPVVAAIVAGDSGAVTRFPSRDHFAAWNGTAPVEVSSGGRKIYRLSRRSPRSGTSTAPAAPTTTRRSPRARPARKRSGASSAGSATRSTPACGPTPARPPPGAREGNRGTTLHPARPACTPSTGSSDQPLPGLAPHYGPGPGAFQPGGSGRRQRPSTRAGQAPVA